MTLLEFANELHLRLVAAHEAGMEDHLLSRAQTVRSGITLAAQQFEAVQSYRITTGRGGHVVLDARKVRRAIGGFRGALSKSGPSAVQQQPADTLMQVLTTQNRRANRWVKSMWREEFATARELLNRVASGDLHGSSADKLRAQRYASKIQVILNTDPVNEQATLESSLRVEGLNACRERVDKLIEDLRAVIAAIDNTRAALTPEVREALQRATTGYGLPLAEVTPELRDAFQSAGVLDDLVVHQR